MRPEGYPMPARARPAAARPVDARAVGDQLMTSGASISVANLEGKPLAEGTIAWHDVNQIGVSVGRNRVRVFPKAGVSWEYVRTFGRA